MSRSALKEGPPRLPPLYYALLGARLALTLAPQLGYIQPDEYFQSMEVIAADIFSIDAARTWEFNSTCPTRNIFMPKITFGVPYHTIRLLGPYLQHYFRVNLRSPYFLLVLPRFWFFCLSLINDYSIYKICSLYGQNYQNRLKIFASSYVMLVFSCRTSNSLEMILFSLLLLLVAECMQKSDRIIYHEEFLQEKYRMATSVVERVKLYKLKTHLPSHSLSRVAAIATLTAVGFFTRPTFLGFSFPPLFFWLQRGLGSKVVTFKHFHCRMIALIICAMPTAVLMVIIDSGYYGYLTLSEVESLKVSMSNFVVTPLNLLLYNMRQEKLVQHGLHPWCLHFAVNLLLAFNVLGVMGLMDIALNGYRFIVGHYSKLPKIQSITGLMLFSFCAPVAFLSLFPHQESRNIIPVLIPLVYLHGNYFYSNPDDTPRVEKFKNTLIAIWYTANFVMTLFFGFLHQGGMYPLVNRLNDEIKSNRAFGRHTHVITSHSYNMPTSLLQIESTSKVWLNKATGQKYKLTPHAFFYEYGSVHIPRLFDRIEEIIDGAEQRGKEYKIYLAAPCSLELPVHEASLNRTHVGIFEEQKFYPHFTTEAIPALPAAHDELCFRENYLGSFRSENLGILQRVGCWLGRFCMKLYRVSVKIKATV